MDWDLARGFVSRIVSRQLHRRVSIDGPLRVQLFSSTPSVSIDDLSIGNPDWAGSGNMMDVRRLTLRAQ